MVLNLKKVSTVFFLLKGKCQWSLSSSCFYYDVCCFFLEKCKKELAQRRKDWTRMFFFRNEDQLVYRFYVFGIVFTFLLIFVYIWLIFLFTYVDARKIYIWLILFKPIIVLDLHLSKIRIYKCETSLTLISNNVHTFPMLWFHNLDPKFDSIHIDPTNLNLSTLVIL